MNKYTFIIKSGKNRGKIIDWVFAETRTNGIKGGHTWLNTK